jgi:LPS sulfotransferase NodH
MERAELNDGIVLYGGPVVFLQRRNLLRRYISSAISSQLRFWIGTRDQFEARVEQIQLRALEPTGILEAIKRDQAAIAKRLQLLEHSGVAVMRVSYEDLYAGNKAAARQLECINTILNFLGFDAMPEKIFETECMRFLDQDAYQWSSPQLYRRIPGIEHVEHEVGSDETGWLFR